MINIIEKKDCSGCKACYNICPESCIKMLTDEEGFWYPKVSKDKCIKCGLCVKVCPEINIYQSDKAYDKPLCLAAWNNNEDERQNSSSGGVFTSIAEWILDNDGVVFGAGYNEHFDVVHKDACSTEEVKELMGSKYVQSDINNTYQKAKRYLSEGKKVLFTGTPCQIAGLYNYLEVGYENLYTCDLICHGVPSSLVFKKYKQNIEMQYESNIKSITFRNKKNGWKNYAVSIGLDNEGLYSETSKNDVYMLGFLRNYYLRPSCYKCSYAKITRISDITLGDYWGISSKYPQLDDDKGTSLLLVNTDKGNYILDACKNNIYTHECDLDHAVSGNPSIISSVSVPKQRQEFFKDLHSKDFDYVIKKYMSPPSWSKKRILFSIRAFRFIKRRLINLISHKEG